ncbi:MAG: twin-arginine translocase subunit TatB [Clostridia bacterium]|nr:twin-arginine translocase subunit TatB [Clostridia bacterium]
MFNIGGMELLLILLVAFLVVGPKDLPRVARWIARVIKKARAYIDQFKDELGLDELEADVKEVTAEVESAVSQADISEEMKRAQDEMRAIAEGVDAQVRQATKQPSEMKDAKKE